MTMSQKTTTFHSELLSSVDCFTDCSI